MMELQNKQEAVESIKNKLTPEYLASATRAILEKDRDEVDNIVKAHHELYDKTNWLSEPAAFIIGYETLKQRIGTLKDEALKAINDRLGELAKEQTVNPPAKNTPKDGSEEANQGGSDQGGAQQGEGKDSPPDPPKSDTPATKDFDVAVAKILAQFEELKTDIKRIREEAVAKESLANQKLQGLETKISRQIREAGNIPTSRDEGEFKVEPTKIAPAKTEPAKTETPAEQVTRVLEELKGKLEKAEAIKTKELTFASLFPATRQALIARKQTLKDAAFSFLQQVITLEGMELTPSQRNELKRVRESAKEYERLFEKTLQEAIDAKEGFVQFVPTNLKEVEQSTSGEQTQPLEASEEDDIPSNPDTVNPIPKPPRRRDDFNSDQNPPDVVVTAPLRLEAINLPFFNGDLTEWTNFRDLFQYLIHNNNHLSDVVKFHQLRSKLRGPALDTIRGYQITGINYLAAWNDLTKRYDRTDNLVQEYIRKFLEVPAILHKPNSYRIRAIIDATNQMIRALPNLGADVHHWDPFISLIVTSKLDEETRTEWRQHIGRRTNATIGELIEFLERRAIDHQPSQGDRLSQMMRGQSNQRNTKRNIFAISNEPSTPPKQKRRCVICKGDHFPWQCPKLRKECAKVRAELIRSVGACVKCLLKHEVGACNKSNCPYCGEEHNSLLCIKKERDLNKRKRPFQSKKMEKPAQNQNSSGDWDDTI